MKFAKITVSLLLAIAIVVMCAGCQAPTTTIPTDDTGETTLPSETIATTVPTASPISYDDLVTDAYAKEESYVDYTGEKVTASFCIPQIHLEYAGITQLNQEIYNDLHSKAEAAIEEIQNIGSPMSYSEISYHWAVNSEILSLVTVTYCPEMNNGWYEFTVYNLDVQTGDSVSDDAVITAAGLTKDEYYEKVKQVLESHFQSMWSMMSVGSNDLYTNALERTLSNENMDKAVPYINENAQLCIIATVPSLAGADHYFADFNIIDTEQSYTAVS